MAPLSVFVRALLIIDSPCPCCLTLLEIAFAVLVRCPSGHTHMAAHSAVLLAVPCPCCPSSTTWKLSGLSPQGDSGSKTVKARYPLDTTFSRCYSRPPSLSAAFCSDAFHRSRCLRPLLHLVYPLFSPVSITYHSGRRCKDRRGILRIYLASYLVQFIRSPWKRLEIAGPFEPSAKSEIWSRRSPRCPTEKARFFSVFCFCFVFVLFGFALLCFVLLVCLLRLVSCVCLFVCSFVLFCFVLFCLFVRLFCSCCLFVLFVCLFVCEFRLVRVFCFILFRLTVRLFVFVSFVCSFVCCVCCLCLSVWFCLFVGLFVCFVCVCLFVVFVRLLCVCFLCLSVRFPVHQFVCFLFFSFFVFIPITTNKQRKKLTHKTSQQTHEQTNKQANKQPNENRRHSATHVRRHAFHPQLTAVTGKHPNLREIVQII